MKDAAHTATAAAAAAPQSGSKADTISSQHRRRVTKQMKDAARTATAAAAAPQSPFNEAKQTSKDMNERTK
jgi:hypothetical protein